MTYGSSQVEAELQLLASTTAKATPDPSHICNLRHRSRQHRIPNSLGEARDGTCILMDAWWIINPLSHPGNSPDNIFLFFFFFFRAAPVAYGNSQARGQIRATAASLYHSHSNAGSKLHL